VENTIERVQGSDDNMTHEHCLLDAKSTNINSEYITVISFPLQQWVNEHTEMFRHAYIAGFDNTHLVNGKNITWISA